MGAMQCALHHGGHRVPGTVCMCASTEAEESKHPLESSESEKFPVLAQVVPFPLLTGRPGMPSVPCNVNMYSIG